MSKRKLIYGIGINDVEYQVQPKNNGKQQICPYYRTWSNMLKRCYSKKAITTYPSYKDCTVCDEWLTFSNFKVCMENQNWKDLQLDKDLLVKGNREYSPNTCIFISAQVNKLLNTNNSSRGEFPIGVSFNKRKNMFQAQCKENGKQKNLGYYSTEAEAYKIYCLFKQKVIINMANAQKDMRIKYALINQASLMEFK